MYECTKKEKVLLSKVKDKDISKFYGLTSVAISNYKTSSKIENNRKYWAMREYFIKWVEENKNV
jgi:hypothetical protein